MNKIIYICRIIVMAAAVSASGAAMAAEVNYPTDGAVPMKATWYGAKYQGKRTANGEVFEMRRLTAAHLTLPLGSLVLVRAKNGRAVTVRITDRPGVDVLDLSRAAARQLHLLYKGTGTVMVQVISENDDG